MVPSHNDNLPNRVEDIDEDEEESDEQCHSPWDDVWPDEEGDPGHGHEEDAGKVDLEDHLVTLPAQVDAETARRVTTYLKKKKKV